MNNKLKIIGLCFFSATLGIAQEAEKKELPTPEAPATEVAEGAEPVEGVEDVSSAPRPTSGSFDAAKLIPLDRPSKNVRIPSYDEGRLTTMVNMATMTRVDDENLDLTELEIELYNRSGESDIVIVTKTAEYHMPTAILTSDSRTKVTRDGEFVIHGDSMQFDTNTQEGKMEGNVQMLIFDMNSMGKKDTSTTTTADPESGDAADPKNSERKIDNQTNQ